MNPHIVIPAAGMGTRYGQNIPKGLIKICGKPLIQWQLEVIPKEVDVTVVIGYKAQLMYDVIKLTRPSAHIATNDHFEYTSTVYSIRQGISPIEERIIILDGDILIKREDLDKFIGCNGEFIGIRYFEHYNHKDPVFVELSEMFRVVLGFSREKKTEYEWACVCSTLPYYFYENKTDKYIYEVLERHLPCKSVLIDVCEIDTPEDAERAETWIKKNFTKM